MKMSCHVCKKSETTMKRCTKCHTVLYCTRECQVVDWPEHKIACQKIVEKSKPKFVDSEAASEKTLIEQNQNETSERIAEDLVTIFVKSNKLNKIAMQLNINLDSESLMRVIAETVKIPLSKLKLICKGKVIDSTNVKNYAKPKSLFLAIGESAENEDGLQVSDIETLMRQLSVDRNTAIKALRKTGDLLDAMLFLGNKG